MFKTKGGAGGQRLFEQCSKKLRIWRRWPPLTLQKHIHRIEHWVMKIRGSYSIKSKETKGRTIRGVGSYSCSVSESRVEQPALRPGGGWSGQGPRDQAPEFKLWICRLGCFTCDTLQQQKIPNPACNCWVPSRTISKKTLSVLLPYKHEIRMSGRWYYQLGRL